MSEENVEVALLVDHPIASGYGCLATERTGTYGWSIGV
jgi:hypothetical protein